MKNKLKMDNKKEITEEMKDNLEWRRKWKWTKLAR